MAKVKNSNDSAKNKSIRPALTPEARENQLIYLATELAEQQLRDGTASSQVITHYLKLGSTKERIEKEILLKQKELISAKTEALQSAKRIEELYRIGYTGTEGDMFLELDFSDETILMLHILVYGKATNNSTLFLKRFLDILDRFMLGSIEGNKTSRRRISMNESTLNKQNNRIEEYGGRKLDINSTVLEGLKEASPVESGRVLEF